MEARRAQQERERPGETHRSPYAAPADQVLRDLGSEPGGLGDEEVARRRARFGPNTLPERKRPGLPVIFLRQFKNPLIYILLIAGLVSVVIGEWGDATFIFAVLLINSAIGTAQEWKAETSADALKRTVPVVAAVRRDGRRQEVPSTELVPGDVVLLEAGATVPADLRLLSAKDLRVDESLLTGESLPVEKDTAAALAGDTPIAERVTMAHAGTTVLDGRGTGVVCDIGRATEVGRIAASLTEEAAAPPLVIRLEQFTRAIALVVLVAVAVLAAGQLLQGVAIKEIFFFSIALAVSAIPAGLPVAITVALAIATQQMAKRHVIVRRLPAVEGLGACTVIASDKTGTLTANELTVTRIELPGGQRCEVEGEGLVPRGTVRCDDDQGAARSEEALRRLAVTGVLCNEAEFQVEDGGPAGSGDAVDVAFLVLGAKLGLQRDALLGQHAEIGAIPFQSARRFAAAFHRDGDRVIAHVKGAAEAVLPMCVGSDAAGFEQRGARLAGEGFRVLAVAAGPVDEGAARQGDPAALSGLEFLGLVGLIDPVRAEVPDAIERCRRARVQVKMITGDHPVTGRAIGRRLGLLDDGASVLTGAELEAAGADDGGMQAKMADAAVFARVEPAQKTAIVKGLQRAGHFVAVTGDGVNDAPALTSANIGVAMGRSGTDVARGAADLILTDDNFASIVNGIEEGRVAYSNVRKVTWLLISTGAAEIVLFFLALATGLPLPLGPIQLLWLNLVTNGIQDVALAFEKGEPGLLDRPPRPPDQPIFDRLMIEETVVSGAYMGAVAFGAFWWLQAAGWSEFEARNMLLLLMVLFENAHIFNCRSESRPFYRVPLRANPLLIGTVALAQAVHIAALYVPGLSAVLRVEPVTLGSWLALLPVALSILLVMELYKRVRGAALSRTWR